MRGDAINTRFVVNDTVFEVRVQTDADSPFTVTITVCLDTRFEWTLNEPGWRPICFGVSNDVPYLWSARNIIVLESSGPRRLKPVDREEDILYAFRRPQGWLLVCETSIRYESSELQVERLDFGTPLHLARIQDHQLVVADIEGREFRLRFEKGLEVARE